MARKLCPWLLARNHDATTCPSCSPKPSIDSDLLIKAAKEFGKAHGYRGNSGGWISYDGRNGRPSRTVAQGWFNFGSLYFREIADFYTARLTAFDTFRGLVQDTDERYCPTIRPTTWRERFLADAFDRAMYDRKSPRRAWRGSGTA